MRAYRLLFLFFVFFSDTILAEDECAVCLVGIDENDGIQLDCGHKYHFKCIRNVYLSEVPNCPLCRVELSCDAMNRVYKTFVLGRINHLIELAAPERGVGSGHVVGIVENARRQIEIELDLSARERICRDGQEKNNRERLDIQRIREQFERGDEVRGYQQGLEQLYVVEKVAYYGLTLAAGLLCACIFFWILH